MNTKRLAALLGLCFAMTAPAARSAELKPNQTISESSVLSGKVALDPTLGYILVRPDRKFAMQFLRVPDAATIADWEHDRQKAFEKAVRKYPEELVTWEDDVKEVRKNRPKGPFPPRPSEPTLETTPVDPLDLRDAVRAGPFGRYAKDDRDNTPFLVAVKPGTYFYAGEGFPLQTGSVQLIACMCMGTVQFDVLPGKVVNLGGMLQQAVLEQGAAPDMDVPDSLKDWPVVPAELHAHGKFNNYWLHVVSRLPTIPGVLSYRRDTVIDERSGQALPSPRLISIQKPKL